MHYVSLLDEHREVQIYVCLYVLEHKDAIRAAVARVTCNLTRKTFIKNVRNAENCNR
jgi:hypothetical protein